MEPSPVVVECRGLTKAFGATVAVDNADFIYSLGNYDQLTITYGDVVAVDDLSFRAEAGEVTCVLGPNGAGKTSTVEALEGLRRPDGGSVRLLGVSPWPRNPALLPRIGVQLQANSFFEQLTAIALLAFRNAGIELAILETGLGGRLDSTTAANASIVAVTQIAMDHEEYLGPTLASIAAEKAALEAAELAVLEAQIKAVEADRDAQQQTQQKKEREARRAERKASKADRKAEKKLRRRGY